MKYRDVQRLRKQAGMGGWFKRRWEDAKAISKKVYQETKDISKGVYQGTKNVVEGTADVFKYPGRYEDYYKKGVGTVIDLFKDPLVERVEEVKDKAKGAMEELKTDAEKKGKDIVDTVTTRAKEQIKDGINSGLASFKERAKAFGKSSLPWIVGLGGGALLLSAFLRRDNDNDKNKNNNNGMWQQPMPRSQYNNYFNT